MSDPLARAAADYATLPKAWQLPQMAAIHLALTPKTWKTSAAAISEIGDRINQRWYGWALFQTSGPRLVGPDWPGELPAGESLLLAELAAPNGIEGLTVTLLGSGDWRGAQMLDGTAGTSMLFDDVVRVVDAAVANRAAGGSGRPKQLSYRRYWASTATDPVIRPRHTRLLGFVYEGTT